MAPGAKRSPKLRNSLHFYNVIDLFKNLFIIQLPLSQKKHVFLQSSPVRRAPRLTKVQKYPKKKKSSKNRLLELLSYRYQKRA